MPKEILNLKEKPLSIDNLLNIEKKLINSPFEFIDIINFSVNDLVFLRRAITVSNEKEQGFSEAEEVKPDIEEGILPQSSQGEARGDTNV